MPSCPRYLVLGLAASLAACAPAEHDHQHAGSALRSQELAALEYRSAFRALAQDPGDIRPQARKFLARLRYDPSMHSRTLSSTLVTLPKTIKVWRRSLGGSQSCSGQVDVIPLETYVKGVLPHEWISSWKEESLKAGAVAIRTYAAAWVLKGGKYTCADLCDTTYSQVYKPSTKPVTNKAVDDTAGQVLVSGGKLVFAEYSAENGDPTKFGVSDPPCAGKPLYGHGRGMCQWGSQRWALQGKGYQWIATHYYPGASLQVPGTGPTPDAGAPPPADSGPPPPTPDQGTPPKADKGAVPKADSKGPPPAQSDGGMEPGVDQGGAPPSWSQNGQQPRTLEGGCAVSGLDATAALPAALLLALLLPGRRRRS